MTILEKAKERYPDLTDDDFTKWGCPHEFGFEDCKETVTSMGYVCSADCPECWNREFEESELEHDDNRVVDE